MVTYKYIPLYQGLAKISGYKSLLKVLEEQQIKFRNDAANLDRNSKEFKNIEYAHEILSRIIDVCKNSISAVNIGLKEAKEMIENNKKK